MAGWHHRLDGREFEWTLGDGDGHGGLVCCDSWSHKELDRTEWMNWTELNWRIYLTFVGARLLNEWKNNKATILASIKPKKWLQSLYCSGFTIFMGGRFISETFTWPFPYNYLPYKLRSQCGNSVYEHGYKPARIMHLDTKEITIKKFCRPVSPCEPCLF